MSLMTLSKRIAAGTHGLDVFPLFGVRGVSRSRPVMPMTAFIGVRISWLMLARNSDLATLAASAATAKALAL